MTTRSIKNKKINDALFSKFKELEAKINSRNVVNFGKKTNSRNVINYGTGNNNKTNSNYTPGSNSNNARNASNSERDLRNRVKEILKTDIALKRKMRKSISLAQLAALKKKKAQGGVQNNGKVMNNNNNVFQNAKNGFNNNNNNIFYNASSSINETWNKMNENQRIQFPIEQLVKGDPKQEKVVKKVSEIFQKKIDSILKLVKEEKPLRAFRTLATFLYAGVSITQSITTGKSTMNKFVFDPIKQSEFAKLLGLGVVSADQGIWKNGVELFQASLSEEQAIHTASLTNATGTGSSIVGSMTTLTSIFISLWIASMGRGKFGKKEGNFVLRKMTEFLTDSTKQMYKFLFEIIKESSRQKRQAAYTRTQEAKKATVTAAMKYGPSAINFLTSMIR